MSVVESVLGILGVVYMWEMGEGAGRDGMIASCGRAWRELWFWEDEAWMCLLWAWGEV